MYLLTYDGDGRFKKFTKRIVFMTHDEVDTWIADQCQEHSLLLIPFPDNWIKLRLPDDMAAKTSWRWDGYIWYKVTYFEPGVGF